MPQSGLSPANILRVWDLELLRAWNRHRVFDFGNGDASLWVILLDVLPVGTVPNDRPIVHAFSISYGDIRWV